MAQIIPLLWPVLCSRPHIFLYLKCCLPWAGVVLKWQRYLFCPRINEQLIKNSAKSDATSLVSWLIAVIKFNLIFMQKCETEIQSRRRDVRVAFAYAENWIRNLFYIGMWVIKNVHRWNNKTAWKVKFRLLYMHFKIFAPRATIHLQC